jgi:hypothetical protein
MHPGGAAFRSRGIPGILSGALPGRGTSLLKPGRNEFVILPVFVHQTSRRKARL